MDESSLSLRCREILQENVLNFLQKIEAYIFTLPCIAEKHTRYLIPKEDEIRRNHVMETFVNYKRVV